ncbi:MAG TPA: hypothetical protein ENN43_00945 [bacterium]|nr:hypothetical protein [bacterium]
MKKRHTDSLKEAEKLPVKTLQNKGKKEPAAMKAKIRIFRSSVSDVRRFLTPANMRSWDRYGPYKEKSSDVRMEGRNPLRYSPAHNYITQAVIYISLN